MSLSKRLIEENRAEAANNARKKQRACRVCGCTDDAACPLGCWWVEPDLCSSCRTTPRVLERGWVATGPLTGAPIGRCLGRPPNDNGIWCEKRDILHECSPLCNQWTELKDVDQ